MVACYAMDSPNVKVPCVQIELLAKPSKTLQKCLCTLASGLFVHFTLLSIEYGAMIGIAALTAPLTAVKDLVEATS